MNHCCFSYMKLVNMRLVSLWNSNAFSKVRLEILGEMRLAFSTTLKLPWFSKMRLTIFKNEIGDSSKIPFGIYTQIWDWWFSKMSILVILKNASDWWILKNEIERFSKMRLTILKNEIDDSQKWDWRFLKMRLTILKNDWWFSKMRLTLLKN